MPVHGTVVLQRVVPDNLQRNLAEGQVEHDAQHIVHADHGHEIVQATRQVGPFAQRRNFWNSGKQHFGNGGNHAVTRCRRAVLTACRADAVMAEVWAVEHCKQLSHARDEGVAGSVGRWCLRPVALISAHLSDTRIENRHKTSQTTTAIRTRCAFKLEGKPRDRCNRSESCA